MMITFSVITQKGRGGTVPLPDQQLPQRQTTLSLYAFKGFHRQILSGMRDGDVPWLCGMLENVMATSNPYQNPSVFLEDADHFKTRSHNG